MELEFSSFNKVSDGEYGTLIHHPDNTLRVLYIRDGRMYRKYLKEDTADYDYTNLLFEDEQIATKDNPIRYMRLKQVSRLGLFGVWVTDDLDKDDNPIEKQRFAIYEDMSDLTDYLRDGQIQMSNDNLIYSLSLELENPKLGPINEERELVVPGMKIELFYNIGDMNEDYPMGVFYIDRVDYSETRDTVSIDCRSMNGKLLRDQQLNENHKFPKTNQAYMTVGEMLMHANIKNYSLEMPLLDFSGAFEFKPDTNISSAIEEILDHTGSYKMLETFEGKLYIGSLDMNEIKDLFHGYTFDKNNLIIRDVSRDDLEVYSKLCVRAESELSYIRTEPFWSDAVYTEQEKAEQLRSKLQSCGWDARVETSPMEEERYKLKIGAFAPIEFPEVERMMNENFDFSWYQINSAESGLTYIHSDAFGSAYGLSGRERVQLVIDEIDKIKSEYEIYSSFESIIEYHSDREWYRLVISYFTMESTLQDAKDYLDNVNTDITWYKVEQDDIGYKIITGGFGDLNGELAIRRVKAAQQRLRDDKGWYSVVEKMDISQQVPGSRIRVDSRESGVQAVETYFSAQEIVYEKKEYQVGENKMYNYLTEVFSPIRELTARERVEEIANDFERNVPTGVNIEVQEVPIGRNQYTVWTGYFDNKTLQEVEQVLISEGLQSKYKVFKDSERKGYSYEFRDIKHEFDWEYAYQKCYYLDVSENTPPEELKFIADELDSQLSRSGKIETFEKSFVPQMIAGDGATINIDGKRDYIGVITDLTHSFGKSGYKTKFTVDSGERKGREQISDFFKVKDGVNSKKL